MQIFKYELGSQAEDTVTGFKGTITGRNEWTNGCKQYCLKAKVVKGGEIKSGEWIDEEDIKILKPAKATTKRETGGPRADSPSG